MGGGGGKCKHQKSTLEVTLQNRYFCLSLSPTWAQQTYLTVWPVSPRNPPVLSPLALRVKTCDIGFNLFTLVLGMKLESLCSSGNHTAGVLAPQSVIFFQIQLHKNAQKQCFTSYLGTCELSKSNKVIIFDIHTNISIEQSHLILW